MKYVAYFCSNSIMEEHIVEKAFVHQPKEVCRCERQYVWTMKYRFQ